MRSPGHPELLHIVSPQTRSRTNWWIQPVRGAAFFVFAAIPVFSLLVPRLAGRVVWTVVIAALPLFIVLVGYHRWRQICPLAFFAQIPARLKCAGKAKASSWLESNYYYVGFGVFFVSLWLRLIATNGNAVALVWFFIALSCAALVSGFVYTGKTWCNFLCPVMFVEKIYTEPRGLRSNGNSQCAECTACKHACPDISEENGYWKEIGSRPKRFAYACFPGLVFSFYLYYYLQAGTWDYYFRGKWTFEPGLLSTVFEPGRTADSAGFFFLIWVPRALAAFLTLAAGASVSLGLFTILESQLIRRSEAADCAARARHTAFSIAAFSAFLLFYAFAGAPTLRLIPGASHWFAVVVTITATLFLVRRLPRTRNAFAEEALALNIVKRWAWTDIPRPSDLHEAFLVHTTRLRETAKGYEHILRTFTEAVRETLTTGFLMREDLRLMETLRDTLGIKQSDYENLISTLAEEERNSVDRGIQGKQWAPGGHLQSYKYALGQYLQTVLQARGKPNDHVISQLRSEYKISKADHAMVLDRMFRESGSPELLQGLMQIWNASNDA